VSCVVADGHTLLKTSMPFPRFALVGFTIHVVPLPAFACRSYARLNDAWSLGEPWLSTCVSGIHDGGSACNRAATDAQS
jgi:hypothetical protein